MTRANGRRLRDELRWVLALIGIVLVLKPEVRASDLEIDYEREIQPIFAQHCSRCHGDQTAKGGLILSHREAALRPTDSGALAIVPGQPEESEVLFRVASDDPLERMPPSGDGLSELEIERLNAWIQQGAEWPEIEAAPHWAYVVPVRPELPEVQEREWPTNAIDHFILERLETEGLEPGPEADRARLIRRVFLDLVGLPPSIEELDAFLNDDRDDAYERVVDALLASPHYGERWARPWLDLARYADSNGFQRDGFRDVWPYRDWVVSALNADLPFDRFTIEQIAGDLLPDATIAQQIATGFHRGPTVNAEAGVDQEENRINAVIDRVNTTATVWLGSTIACAQCHDHKYDPFSIKEYYQLFAYFNNTPIETRFREAATDMAAIDFEGPYLTLPIEPAKQVEREELAQERVALAEACSASIEQARSKLATWEEQLACDTDRRDALPETIRRISEIPTDQRSTQQQDRLVEHYLGQQPEVRAARRALAEVEERLDALEPPRSLVMQELSEPRTTHVFQRGNFLEHGAEVGPGVPSALHPLPEDAPANRLGLARWLVDRNNPLVARVTVNRWWSEFFGQGLVATLEDFGSQAEPPTHPELLDWLAVEFVEGGWSMKRIHRLIVTSSTYRQSSRWTPEAHERDPRNRLYARGPRYRLEAETIRDNALAISGLLSPRLGGPPVYPPQPEGIWRVTGLVDNTYRTSKDADRYRRGMYTIWRRSAPYPSFVAFDAPDRASCVVQRPRANTPLQALTLLNDPAYVEMSKAFATRILVECSRDDISERIRFAFRLCLIRMPSDVETRELEQIYQQQHRRFTADPNAASALLEGWALPEALDPVEWAAWFAVSSVLLNLDETITKG